MREEERVLWAKRLTARRMRRDDVRECNYSIPRHILFFSLSNSDWSQSHKKERQMLSWLTLTPLFLALPLILLRLHHHHQFNIWLSVLKRRENFCYSKKRRRRILPIVSIREEEGGRKEVDQEKERSVSSFASEGTSFPGWRYGMQRKGMLHCFPLSSSSLIFCQTFWRVLIFSSQSHVCLCLPLPSSFPVRIHVVTNEHPCWYLCWCCTRHLCFTRLLLPWHQHQASPAAGDSTSRFTKADSFFLFSITGSAACISIETRSTQESCSRLAVCLLPSASLNLHTGTTHTHREEDLSQLSKNSASHRAQAIESEAWDERHASLFPLLVSSCDITMAPVSGQGFRRRTSPASFSFHSLFTREAVAFVS